MADDSFLEELGVEKPISTIEPQIPVTPTPSYDPRNDDPKDQTKPGALDLPLPGAGAPELSTIESRLDALANIRANLSTDAIDQSMQYKSQRYGADINNHQYERYYSMPDVHEKLGFSPFRDNETLYNKESNFADEISRASSQWLTLAGIGLVDATGFGSLTDSEVAARYQKATAIGSSTKEGLGAFTTNLYLNLGYSAGILAEVMVEEVALALITGASMGSAGEITIPAMIARGLRAGNKITKGYKVAKNTIRTLKALKNPSVARKYFNKALKGTGRFLNPLENTVDFIQGVDKLGDIKKIAKTTLGVAGFYKDVRNIRYAWGEAGLEGGMVKNDLEKELLAEHYDKFNRPPTNEEAKQIQDISLRGGQTAAWQNVGAIYYSNKIVLDGLFNAYKPLRNLTTDVLDDGSWKIIKKRGKEKNVFEGVEINWKQRLKEFKDPKRWASTGLNYFSANLAEGMQESAQEVISGAAIDHHKNEWRGNVTKGGYLSSIADNLYKQATPQGVEVFMSGFLMGGMMGPLATTMGSIVPGSRQQSFIKNSYKKLADRTGYDKMKKDKENYINNQVNTLNELWNEIGHRLAPELDNLVAQDKYMKAMANAEQEGNTKAYYDIKDAMLSDHVITALELNRFDTFIERLSELKNLSAEDIAADHPKLTKEQYDGIIDNSISRAKNIQARYELTKTEFKDPFNPYRFKDKDSDEFLSELANSIGWKDAQKKFIFMQHSFDRTLERFASIMESAQKDTNLGNVSTTEFITMFHIATMQAEIDRLGLEIDALEDTEGRLTEESKNQLKKSKKKKRLLNDFATKMEAARTSPALDEKGLHLDMKNKETKSNLAKAKTAYKRYLRHLAEVHGNHVFDNALDKSFDKLLDAYILNEESADLNTAINRMLDPGVFTRMAAQSAEINKIRKDQQQKELRDSLEAFVDAKLKNDMFQLLHAKGMFADIAQLKALMKDGVVPDNFKFYYDTGKSSDEIKPVPPNSSDYSEAIGIILDVVPNLLNIPLSKTKMDRAKDIYNNEAREKFEDDKRTYADLAKQFNFNAKDSETKVSLINVLTAIIESDYATEAEILLAKQLLKRAGKNETVTFVNNADNPGSYGTTKQTVIDARYNASNYRNGRLPIEFVILHEEIHRRTVDALKEDMTFNDSISKLFAATVKYFEENKTMENEKPLYGLKDIHEFVAEAMSNSKFQELLSQIPYESTGKSTWGSFVDSVLKMLEQLFGGKKASGTVLNEAFYIITAKIDENFGIKSDLNTISDVEYKNFIDKGTVSAKRLNSIANKIKNDESLSERESAIFTAKTSEINKLLVKLKDSDIATPKPGIIKKRTKTNTKITKAISIPELSVLEPSKDDVTLAQMLLDAYRVVNEETEGAYDPDIATKKDEKILESVGFTKFFNEHAEAQNVLDAYNTKEKLTLEPLLKAVSSTNMGEAVRKRLNQLGYTDEEIKKFKNIETRVRIANENIHKSKRELDAQLSEEEDLALHAQEKENIRKEMVVLLDEAQTLIELQTAKDLIYLLLDTKQDPNNKQSANGWKVAEMSPAELEVWYKARKQDIAGTVNFDDIMPGQIIIMKNGSKVEVTDVIDNTISGFRVSNPTKLEEVTRAEMESVDKSKNPIKFVATAAAIDAEIEVLSEEEITDDDNNVSNQTQTNSEEINTKESFEDDKNSKDDDDDFLDDVNDCNKP